MKFNEEALKKLETISEYEIDIKAYWQPCEECGQKTGDVHFTVDPCIDEIHNEKVWKFMCQDCIHNSCMDI